MRVALVSPPWFPVPPRAYGGTELVVSLLAEGLVAAGVETTLFASGDSDTTADLESHYDVAPSHAIGRTDWDLDHVLHAAVHSADFDVVHDHSGPLGLVALKGARGSLVHTIHGDLAGGRATRYVRACAVARGVGLVSLSRKQRRPAPQLPWRANIPNGIDFARYRASMSRDDYFVFLGRMSPDKGADRAIEIARAAGRHLVMAAKCRERSEVEYFERKIEPLLDDDVTWLGEIGHDAKVALLERCAGLLFPIEWEEPFGLVMIEAMACGAPVYATSRGSVPEVVDPGRTGLVADDYRALIPLVREAPGFSPEEVRAHAELRFSSDQLVEQHLRLYERTVRDSASRGSGTTRVATRRQPTQLPPRRRHR